MGRTEPSSRAVEQAIIGLARAEQQAEVDVLGAVLFAPVQGVTTAKSVGVSAESFGEPDCRAIWIAVDTLAGRVDMVTLALACRRALRWIGCWGLWDDERLARLFYSMPSQGVLPSLCDQMLDLSRRIQAADHHLWAAHRALGLEAA